MSSMLAQTIGCVAPIAVPAIFLLVAFVALPEARRINRDRKSD